MPIKKTIICMKWGTLYSAGYVNVLYNAVRNNITGDFRFVCITDDATGIDENVDCFPIPDIGLRQKDWYDGAWPKLTVFLPKQFGLEGRCLFIDLDSVILSSLDDFFHISGKIVAIDLTRFNPKAEKKELLSGVFAFDADSLGHIVETIQRYRDTVIDKCKLEQSFISDQVPDWVGWPNDWVISFKYALRQPLILDRIFKPKLPPASAKIIAFHGTPRPIDIILPKQGNWDCFPHYGSGIVDWARNYWIQNGGEI